MYQNYKKIFLLQSDNFQTYLFMSFDRSNCHFRCISYSLTVVISKFDKIFFSLSDKWLKIPVYKNLNNN